MIWGAVGCLPLGYHSESIAPILVRNEVVFAQSDLRQGRSWPGIAYDGHSINFRKVLLLATYSSVQRSTIHDGDSGFELARAPARVEVSRRSR